MKNVALTLPLEWAKLTMSLYIGGRCSSAPSTLTEATILSSESLLLIHKAAISALGRDALERKE